MLAGSRPHVETELEAARSEALQSIQDSLGLADAPLRIECVDISHVQGTDVVASLVVFEDGLPRKSDYRHYAISEAAGDGRSDDVASIAEVTLLVRSSSKVMCSLIWVISVCRKPSVSASDSARSSRAKFSIA